MTDEADIQRVYDRAYNRGSRDAAGDRPQDVGRSHSRKPTPSPDTYAVLDRYHAAMRDELDALLDELAVPAGQMLAFDSRPTLDYRRPLWDLAVKLARELAAERTPAELSERPGGTARRSRPAPRLTVAARRALGQ